MASSVSRRLTTKLLKPCQYSSSFSSSPAYSISHSPKTFTFDQSRLMSSLFDSSLARVENPINHDLSFFRLYSSSSSKLNPSSHLQETLKRPNTKSLLQEKPRNPGLRYFSTPPECDLSALANETRAVLEQRKRTRSDLSKAFVLLGLVDLSRMVLMAYITPSPLTELITIQSLTEFPLDFLCAFVMQPEPKYLASRNEMINEMEQKGQSDLLT